MEFTKKVVLIEVARLQEVLWGAKREIGRRLRRGRTQKKNRGMLMKDQLVDFHGSILLSLLSLSLLMLLIIYVCNYFFIKKNSKELSEIIYGVDEYLDHVGLSFEIVLQLYFIFTNMFISYFIELKFFGKTFFFAKRGEKSPSIYPNLYQDNVVYLCEKFKNHIIINEVLSLIFIFFGILVFSMNLLLIF